MIRKAILTVLAVMCVSLLVFAKDESKPSELSQNGPAKPQSQLHIPTFEVRFSEESAMSIPFPEHFPAIAKQCGSHGAPFMWLLGSSGMEVVGFTADGMVTFPKNKMSDIPEPSLGEFFVADTGVYVRVTGLKNAKKETVTDTDEKGKEFHRTRTIGEQHQYVARFSTDGSYKGAIELDFPFEVNQIATFDSGDFLIAGVDAQKVPRVAAMNSSGQLQKFVELDKDITGKPKSTAAAFKRASGAEASMETIATFAQFIPYRGDILLVRNRTSNVVYEIRDGGEARAVRIKAPDGFIIDRIIPSDSNDWLIEFFKPIAGGSFTEGERACFSVNPENGELVNRYRFKNSDLNLACRYQDDFVAVRQHEGRLTILRGQAEPAVAEKAAPQ